MDTWGT